MENKSQYGNIPSGGEALGHNASPPIAYKGQSVPDMVRKTYDPASTSSAVTPKTAKGGAQAGK
jgi:hypothetical protein